SCPTCALVGTQIKAGDRQLISSIVGYGALVAATNGLVLFTKYEDGVKRQDLTVPAPPPGVPSQPNVRLQIKFDCILEVVDDVNKPTAYYGYLSATGVDVHDETTGEVHKFPDWVPPPGSTIRATAPVCNQFHNPAVKNLSVTAA